ncbi:hypothetical protein ACIQY5_24240 [Peribacillus frigoritolerans]|uniref:hypothetical protein n=1 Tax=Peribacillus frigoritolerans TaxID=450367 RepID=UPI003825A50A
MSPSFQSNATLKMSHNITPFLLTLPPLDPARYYRSIADKFGHSIGHFVSHVGGIEHWHGMYNRQLKSLAEELKVPLIDVRSYIKSSGDLGLAMMASTSLQKDTSK